MKKNKSINIIEYDNSLHRDAVMELWQQMFGYEDARNVPGFVIDQKMAVADGLFWVAVCNGAVVGSVMAGYDGHRGWIYSMAVVKQEQHNGVGSALLKHAETQLSDLGCVKINLQIMGGNEAVQEFYGTNGYVVENRISMGKQIKANLPG
jgi:ribosomal protein S18 acetylase RimI-like enzyme